PAGPGRFDGRGRARIAAAPRTIAVFSGGTDAGQGPRSRRGDLRRGRDAHHHAQLQGTRVSTRLYRRPGRRVAPPCAFRGGTDTRRGAPLVLRGHYPRAGVVDAELLPRSQEIRPDHAMSPFAFSKGIAARTDRASGREGPPARCCRCGQKSVRGHALGCGVTCLFHALDAGSGDPAYRIGSREHVGRVPARGSPSSLQLAFVIFGTFLVSV